jgi:aspartate aminotransferase
MSFVAARLQSIKTSPTLAVNARATRLKSEGKDIIGLGAGEPDFDTPQFIKDAAVAAIAKGLTKYTAAGGTPSLKKAIIAKFKRDNNLDYTEKQVLVSCGGKQSCFNLCLALLNKGDEVIIPAPYWVSYPDMVLMADAKPVIVAAGIEQGFRLKAGQLEAAITPKTRMIFLNSPSNPSAAVYTLDELKAVGEVLRKHPDIVIATDDMYEHILLKGQKFVNILDACPDLYPRTVVLNGVSKAYSMTGWRIGYCGGPAELIAAMENVQSHSTSNPASISQYAAEAALNGDQSCIEPMVKAFKARGRFVFEGLNRIPGVKCLDPEGAFYVFPDCRGAIKRLHAAGKLKDATDLALCDYLMEQPEAVAAVPGSAFGMEGYLRISFATSMENLEKAIARMARAMA